MTLYASYAGWSDRDSAVVIFTRLTLRHRVNPTNPEQALVLFKKPELWWPLTRCNTDHLSRFLLTLLTKLLTYPLYLLEKIGSDYFHTKILPKISL
jgi:hypothetical protein